MGGAATSIFIATKVCHDKITFVVTFVATNDRFLFCLFSATKIILVVAPANDTNVCLSRSKRRVCHDKMFVVASILLSRQKCVLSRQKLYLWKLQPEILYPALKQMAPQFARDYVKHVGPTHRQCEKKKKN